MRDDEGILVGRRRFDLGSEAVVERKLGLVLVNDAREVTHGRRRQLGLCDQQPFQPDGSDIVVRDRRRGGQHSGRHRLLGNGRVFPGDRFRGIDRVQGKAAAPGILLVALVLQDSRGMRDRNHGTEARREQLLEGRARRGHLDPRSSVRAFGEFENGANECDAALALGQYGDLLFLQVRNALDLLAAGADQQHHVMVEDRDRAGAGRNLGVGAQDRKVGFLAVELCERLCIVAAGHDLQPQPRRIILQERCKPGGETRLGAVGLADGKDQRLGIAKPDPAAPHRGGGQDQGEDRKQKDLRAVAFDDPRAATRHFWVRRWGFSTHGSYPVRGRFAVKSAPQAVRMNS